MSSETKTAALYLAYKAIANLAAADLHAAFALKDDGVESWRVYDMFVEEPPNMPSKMLRYYDTPFDPRDYMKSCKSEEFHMVKLRTGLTPEQKAQVMSILIACVSGEGWPENALTEMESQGLLNGEQKAEAIENRRNSANILYNSQTNGA